MEVGEGDGESIGGIGGWGLGETEKGADHESDLVFVCSALSNNGHFDFLGRVFVNGDAVIRGSDECRGPCCTHGNGGAVRLHINDALDGDFIRLVLLDKVNQMGMDGREGAGLGNFFRDGDNVVADHDWFAWVALENGITGVADGRIYGEDTHA